MTETTAELKNAPAGPLPPFVDPQLATLVSEAPAGDDWLHEMKFDGFRILARLEKGRAQLLTRSGQDWTQRFAIVARAIEALPAQKALLDGEVAVVTKNGTTSFQALQNLDASAGQLAYFAFDLLHLDGRDLRPLPIEARKAQLERLVKANKKGDVVRYTDHVVGDGPAFFAEASRSGLEGIISKRRGQPYATGRGPDWVKTKAVKRQEFVIGGFTDPNGARQGIGALLVGVYDKGKLRYAGKVGTGYTQKSAAELRRRLGELASDDSPFSSPIRPAVKGVHWVAPRLLAEVGFTEMTADGKLRHPSFQGLREDKRATEVRVEVPLPTEEVTEGKTASTPKAKTAKASRKPGKPRAKADTAPGATPEARAKGGVVISHKGGEGAEIAGVTLTHPDRVLYPDIGLTKRQLAEYYEAIADLVVPEVAGRPLSLVRCPEGMAGQCFYMKHAMRGTAATLRRVHIKERKSAGEYLVADSLAGLIGVAQMSVLEVHTWNSTTDHLEQPDRVIFDLDPGPAVKWKAVVTAAEAIRDRLRKLGFASFVKSTGGKGLHVVVPLVPDADWEACFLFTRIVSEGLVAEDPGRYTTEMSKDGREEKILIDHYRNRRGSTAVAAYSTRARPGAPVSLPLAWDEIADFSPDRPYTVPTALDRLRGQRVAPWSDYEKQRKPLSDVLASLAAGAPKAPTPKSRRR